MTVTSRVSRRPCLLVVAGLLLAASPAALPAQALSVPLDRAALDAGRLDLRAAVAEVVEYRGGPALRVAGDPGAAPGSALVLLDTPPFRDGTIELELAGEPAPDADPSMRGFVGVAFRVAGAEAERYECFYLRPTNGRAADPVRRSHATQYVSHPEWTWQRLRRESPGAYETSADIEPGAWTRVRVEVAGDAARLYLGGSGDPTLVVEDLKGEQAEGRLALWLHTSTVAHFRNLVVTPAP